MICMPGLRGTGEPPSFKLDGSLMPLGFNSSIAWISPDHKNWKHNRLLSFDDKADADRWLIEFLLGRPPVDPELAEYEVDPIVVEDRACVDWHEYRG